MSVGDEYSKIMKEKRELVENIAQLGCIEDPLEYESDLGIEPGSSYQETAFILAIAVSNHIICNSFASNNEALLNDAKKMLESAKTAERSQSFNTQTKRVPSSSKKTVEKKVKFGDFVDNLLYRSLIDIEKFLKSRTNPDDIVMFKFEIIRKINVLKNKNNLSDKEKNTLIKLQELLKNVIMLEQKKQDVIKEKEDKAKMNVLILPNRKDGSFLLDDLETFSKKDEFVLAFDKFLKGQTDGKIKKIQKIDYLYEYREDNGIRILFILNGNNYVICSLFYKDKDKSTEIDGLYYKANDRYNSSIDQLLSLNTEELMTFQKELLVQIHEYLEVNSNRKIKK